VPHKGGKSHVTEVSMEELLSYEQAAKLLNIKLGTLYCMVAQQRIPHIRLGKRLVRFPRTALQSWLEEHSVAIPERMGGSS
jgi:excisionase family DNA binding protein